MIVYHGSYKEIKEIDLSKGLPFKDFGKGFYVTKFKEQADLWATRKGQHHKNNGFVTEFDFNNYAFNNEDIKSIRFEDYDEKWFDFVILNRQNETNVHDYDIIEGPVADDKVQNRIDEYLRGGISKADFSEELKWHKETQQICFCSTKSLLYLKQNKQELFRLLHISEPIIEGLVIDFDLNEETASEKFFTSKTFLNLTDISTGFYLKDWAEIYDLLIAELNLKE